MCLGSPARGGTAPGVGVGALRGGCGRLGFFAGGGGAEVADDAGGGPGVGEGGSGGCFSEADDEAVHFLEQLGGFAEFGAEGEGEGAAAGDGGGGVCDDGLEVGGFLVEQGGIGGGEVVLVESGGVFGEGGGELLVEELGLADEIDIAEALPGGEGEVDLGGVALAAVFLVPVGEGLADLVGEGFEFLFLALLGLGVTGGGGLLGAEEGGEAFDERPQGGGAGGEGGGFLVFPSGVELGVVEEFEHGEVHVLAVGVAVLHGVCLVWFIWWVLVFGRGIRRNGRCLWVNGRC